MKVRFVLQITGPDNHPNVGAYIRDFDPKGAEGRGAVTVTEDVDRAKKFRDPDRAERFYLQEAASGDQALRYFSVGVVPVMKG